MIEQYIKPGTMRPLKGVLGIILIVVGLAQILKLNFILDYVIQYPTILSIILIISGYLLYIAGRRK